VWVFVLYPMVLHMLLAGAACVRKDTLRLVLDLGTVCQSPEHVQWFRLSVFGLIMYAIGLPSLLFFQLFRVRNNLQDIEVRRNFGFLYNGFQPRFYYLEIVYMFRKAAVLSALIIPSAQGRLLVMLVIGSVFMGVHIRCEPYDDRDFGVLDRLEFLALLAFLASCSVSLWYVNLSDQATDLDAAMQSVVVDWILVSGCACIHAAFLALTICSLLRNLVLKQMLFLNDCFPGHLSGLQRRLLRLMEGGVHHIKMDPDTHELDISELSQKELHFLHNVLCDTMENYFVAALRPVPPVQADASALVAGPDGQSAEREPRCDSDFYVGFMLAALRRAYKRAERSRYQRALSYLKALDAELQSQHSWFARTRNSLQRPFRMDGVQKALEDSAPEQAGQAGLAITSRETLVVRRGLLSFISNPLKTRTPSKASFADGGSAERRALTAVRGCGVTVEEMHLALMLSWQQIAEGREQYFVLETREDRERAFRRDVMSARGATWQAGDSMRKLFRSLELRRNLRPAPDAEPTPPQSQRGDDDAGDVEALLGMRPAAEVRTGTRTLQREHDRLMAEVLELREANFRLEQALRAAGHNVKPQRRDLEHLTMVPADVLEEEADEEPPQQQGSGEAELKAAAVHVEEAEQPGREGAAVLAGEAEQEAEQEAAAVRVGEEEREAAVAQREEEAEAEAASVAAEHAPLGLGGRSASSSGGRAPAMGGGAAPAPSGPEEAPAAEEAQRRQEEPTLRLPTGNAGDGEARAKAAAPPPGSAPPEVVSL